MHGLHNITNTRIVLRGSKALRCVSFRLGDSPSPIQPVPIALAKGLHPATIILTFFIRTFTRYVFVGLGSQKALVEALINSVDSELGGR